MMLEATAVQIDGKRNPVIAATLIVPILSKNMGKPVLYMIKERSTFTKTPQKARITRRERILNFLYFGFS